MPSAEDPSARNLASSQQRIETALLALTETVNRKFDELGVKYVPREELNQRFSSVTEHQLRQDERLTYLEGGREVDRTAFEARSNASDERHRVDRFNAKIIAVSGGGGLVGLLALVIAHWR